MPSLTTKEMPEHTDTQAAYQQWVRENYAYLLDQPGRHSEANPR